MPRFRPFPKAMNLGRHIREIRIQIRVIRGDLASDAAPQGIRDHTILPSRPRRCVRAPGLLYHSGTFLGRQARLTGPYVFGRNTR
ncbi:protein of unknown function [Azospirillum lipoferum 4B]|uniref:Uncharacterized protein n=1 Tax=Azospirillum lipoferum (strain 4B) TaxID=862719 RepID=G7Z3F9_AZOL4|nr:protein of unknown function [Azospirillum lipoferum 4B]